MEKYIAKWSYWLGVLALVLALLARAVDVFAPTMNVIRTRGDSIGYVAYMHGAFLFFVTTIASTSYIWFKSLKTQDLPGDRAQKDRADEIVRDLVKSSSTEKLGR